MGHLWNEAQLALGISHFEASVTQPLPGSTWEYPDLFQTPQHRFNRYRVVVRHSANFGRGEAAAS